MCVSSGLLHTAHLSACAGYLMLGGEEEECEQEFGPRVPGRQ